MKLERLKKQHALLGSAITIGCLKCKERTSWNDAVERGWSVDRDGNPLLAYYCLVCGEKLADKKEE